MLRISGAQGAAEQQTTKNTFLMKLFIVYDAMCCFSPNPVFHTCLMCMWCACAVAASQVAARRDGHRVSSVARQIWQGAHWRCVVTVDDIISLRCCCLVQLGPFDWGPRDLQGLRRHKVYSNILWATRNWGRGGVEKCKNQLSFRVCCSWNPSCMYVCVLVFLLVV